MRGGGGCYDFGKPSVYRTTGRIIELKDRRIQKKFSLEEEIFKLKPENSIDLGQTKGGVKFSRWKAQINIVGV